MNDSHYWDALSSTSNQGQSAPEFGTADVKVTTDDRNTVKEQGSFSQLTEHVTSTPAPGELTDG